MIESTRGVSSLFNLDATGHNGSYRSLRDGFYLTISQAFHARLPSTSPSGMQVLLLMPVNSLIDVETRNPERTLA
jgi:hypothetical protein